MKPRRAKVPVILISGVDAEPMIQAAISMQLDLPTAVVVRHELDPDRELLVRTVSDVNGVIEHVEIDVEHACTSCATREDVVPTLERLAASGRWGAIIAQLPVTAEPMQVCRMISYSPQSAPHVRVAATLVALDGSSVSDDLIGDDLLIERGLPVRDDDERGVGETASAMVEYADVVAAIGEPSTADWELLRALARPGAQLTDSCAELDASALVAGVHDHEAAEEWVAVVRRDPLPQTGGDEAWVLEISSERPLHPERLQQTIVQLGGGARRSRGCFWLPSRPTQVCQWDGAGGMVSIGPADRWDGTGPLTRIVMVGLDAGRDQLAQAFAACLLTDDELAERGRYWELDTDGFEPWLGPIHQLERKAS